MKTLAFIISLLGIHLVSAQQKDGMTDSITQHSRSALVTTDLDKTARKKDRKSSSLILPACLITYGFIALDNIGLKKLDNDTKLKVCKDNTALGTKLDNYLQYAPAIAVYGLNAFGIKGKNNFRDRTMIYALSTMISAAFVLPIKKVTEKQRPDGSAFTSFPSGHTATAFVSAEFLLMEYKDVSIWYGVAGYAIAATTGILRVYNNKHWISDVVAGAGFGILSTRLAYWIYPAIKKKLFKDRSIGSNTIIMPYYRSGEGGLAMVYNF